MISIWLERIQGSGGPLVITMQVVHSTAAHRVPYNSGTSDRRYLLLITRDGEGWGPVCAALSDSVE